VADQAGAGAVLRGLCMEKRMMDAAAVSDRGEWMERGAIWITARIKELEAWKKSVTDRIQSLLALYGPM